MTAARSHGGGPRTFENAANLFSQVRYPGSDVSVPNLGAAHREFMEFLAMRLEKDSDTMRAAARCDNWSEALQIQLQWAQEMIRDYGAEMSRLVALSGPNHAGRGDERRR